MKSIAYLLVAATALLTNVLASSAQFSSPHVADLAKDFDEKVSAVRLTLPCVLWTSTQC